MFNVCDVKKYVEVWHEQHACGILKVLGEVFGDVVLWIGMKFMMTQVCFQ